MVGFSDLTTTAIVLAIPAYGIVWSMRGLRRNRKTFEFRAELGRFVFQRDENWRRQLSWYNALASYEEMSRTPIFLSCPPLDEFVTGEFAEEFFEWRRSQ